MASLQGLHSLLKSRKLRVKWDTLVPVQDHFPGLHSTIDPSVLSVLWLSLYFQTEDVHDAYLNDIHKNDMHTNDTHPTIRSHKIPNAVMAEQENNFYHTLNGKHANESNPVKDINASAEMVNILYRQLEALRKLAGHSDVREHLTERVGEWQLVAKVLDRIFFILFFCIKVGTVIGILMRISTEDKSRPLEN